MNSSWHSYPKIWNLGHANLKELFLDEIHIEEKIDGSQFSFGLFNGEIKCKSKSQELILDAPEKMFNIAVQTVLSLKHLLKEGYTYRGEYLQKPKHNALAYDRVPTKNIIIFDISPNQEEYLSYEDKAEEAKRLGLEIVPCFYKGTVDSPDQLLELLNNTSVLGGQKIEGFVIKNYKRFGIDGKVLLAKHVSEAFKEVHRCEWKKGNPQQNDIIDILTFKYKTPARWNKAIQHLKEKGLLTNSPKDIGGLIKEVQFDVKEECQEEIKELLFNWAWPAIQRKLVTGLPEWYKEELLKSQFKL